MIKIESLKTTIPTDNFGYAVTPVDSFLDALMTRPRSVIYKDKYGTLFSTRKHRTFNGSTLIDIRRDLKDACSFDPRLNFQDVKFDLSEVNIGNVSFDVYLDIGVISGRLVA